MNAPHKIKLCLVALDNDYISIGLRKIAAIARKTYPDADFLNIASKNIRSKEDLRFIAERIAAANVACFSCMTAHAETAKNVIAAAKTLNPSLFIIWGGVHAILCPEDVIKHADAVCVGEGEKVFLRLLSTIEQGSSYRSIGNFWFRDGEVVIKNGFLPLNTPQEMSGFPFHLFMDDELLFVSGRGFIPFRGEDFIKAKGLFYTTIWSIGCPNKCTYCSNSKFIKNDPTYGRIRYPSARYIIDEIKNVLSKYPYLSAVTFVDDGFMSIPLNILKEFAELWKKEVNMPFAVGGIIPAYVNEEKISILVRAGLVRMRMGIQSGSDDILKFYQRPNRPGLIQDATKIIGRYSSYMVPPNYDIILDNPIETRDDIIRTLELVYGLPRPFTLYLFSLRVIPNTQLAADLKERGISIPDINSSFHCLAPTLANILIVMLVFVKLPRKVFDRLLKDIYPATVKQKMYPRLMKALMKIYRYRVICYEVFNLEISWMGGQKAVLFSKLGINRLFRNAIMRRISKIQNL
ncbi:MAG: radical SAM protein [Candidatus Omnitrophota bacterium]|nr:radical SAM protein [Candidatus Omnitrophota bacterium]